MISSGILIVSLRRIGLMSAAESIRIKKGSKKVLNKLLKLARSKITLLITCLLYLLTISV